MKEKEFLPEQNQVGKSALEILGEMPAVQGDELTKLLDMFQVSLDSVLQSEQKLGYLYKSLSEINPGFELAEYSFDGRANVLANVVAGYYAPLVHGFSGMVLKNIKAGNLPNTVIAPPRDTIPIASSIREMSKLTGVDVVVLKPSITRKTAGVYNNQNGEIEDQDPLFSQMIKQLTNGVSEATEVEFGIYSTTSLVTAVELSKNGMDKYVPLKFYGLGPNLSWVHALLSNGQEWIAEKAELNGQVSIEEVAYLMVLLDSLEEFGMQNMYKSVSTLMLNEHGVVEPVIEEVDKEVLEIAVATNKAVIETAGQYVDINPEKIVKLLKAVPDLVGLAKQGFPVMLSSAIPPMDNHNEHFQKIRDSGIFDYPNLIV